MDMSGNAIKFHKGRYVVYAVSFSILKKKQGEDDQACATRQAQNTKRGGIWCSEIFRSFQKLQLTTVITENSILDLRSTNISKKNDDGGITNLLVFLANDYPKRYQNRFFQKMIYLVFAFKKRSLPEMAFLRRTLRTFLWSSTSM